MTANEFIFSNKLKYRLARHLVFWAIYFIYTVVYWAPLDTESFSYSFYSFYLIEALDYSPVYVLSVYFLIYYILPHYLKKRKILFLTLEVIVLAVITMVACFFISKTYVHNKRPDWGMDEVITLTIIKWRMGIVISVAALIIKIMKDYFLKQEESEKLIIENISNNLRLLKMQMHPHILFECLHNIYMDINAGTKHAPEMILKLSELLSYLLYETESNQVELEKEIKMIMNYAELKKLEYKDLDVSFKISGEINSHYIMPGLFLSLLEAGIFLLDENKTPCLVTIELKTVSSQLYFYLKNISYDNKIKKIDTIKEILDKTKKRLDISYAHNYKLETYSATDGFTIILQLELDKAKIVNNKNIQIIQST